MRFLTVFVLINLGVERAALLKAYASMPKRQPVVTESKAKKTGPQWITGAGAVFGGKAGAGFSLLSAQFVQAKNKKSERLVFRIGDREGATLMGMPGYFHAELKGGQNRLVIDFSQTPKSLLSESTLRSVLKNSALVKGFNFLNDPLDGSIKLVIDFKKPVAVRAFHQAQKKAAASVVIDFKVR